MPAMIRAAKASNQGPASAGPEQAPMSEGLGLDAELMGNQAMLEQLRSGALDGDDKGIAQVGFSGRAGRLPYAGFMEQAFGQSFGGVRVFMDTAAQAAAQALGAEAYTMGEQLAFGSPSPAKEVVAHELAHVVQQRLPGSGGADPEADADAAAQAALSGAPVQIMARISAGALMFWNSHEHRAFGNLGAIRANGGDFHLEESWDYSKEDTDGVLARLDEQGRQAQTLRTNDSTEFIYAPGPDGRPVPAGSYRQENEISLGAANEFAGDYTRNVDELANEKSSAPKSETMFTPDWFNMVSIAETNIAHFFPLNQNEYKAHHDRALSLARQAHAQQDDDLAREALLTEGFAGHFLQDCFAAGHMVPRMLDVISVSGQTQEDLGLHRSKLWHDTFNALPNGLPTTLGNFHGDDTMDSNDLNHIGTATGDSLKAVIDTLQFGSSQLANPELPSPSVSAILADAEAGPLWQAMMEDYEEDLREAEETGGDDFVTNAGTHADNDRTASQIRAGTFGGQGQEVKRLTNAEWNGNILVYNLTVDGQPASEDAEIWIRWYDQDSGIDRNQTGHYTGKISDHTAPLATDTDEAIGGAARATLTQPGIGSAQAPVDDTNDVYAVFFADAGGMAPIGRSNPQGNNRGDVEKPLTVGRFSWSGATLSFDVQREGQDADGETVYLLWYNEDSSNDRDAEGNLAQTIVDTDSQVGEVHSIAVSGGRGRLTATGSADNSNDTYGVVYLDSACTIPLARSPLQP